MQTQNFERNLDPKEAMKIGKFRIFNKKQIKELDKEAKFWINAIKKETPVTVYGNTKTFTIKPERVKDGLTLFEDKWLLDAYDGVELFEDKDGFPIDELCELAPEYILEKVKATL